MDRYNGNGRSAPIPLRPEIHGGVLIAGSALRDRVAEIAAARLKTALAPIGIEVTVTVACPLKADSVDVDAVQRAVDDARWTIREKLLARGIDPSSGEVTIGEGRGGQNPQGIPACELPVRWTPKTVPALSVVK